ncbi:hypothetical protein AX17_007108, partial [Amanita inopinata Kibby_2008]
MAADRQQDAAKRAELAAKEAEYKKLQAELRRLESQIRSADMAEEPGQSSPLTQSNERIDIDVSKSSDTVTIDDGPTDNETENPPKKKTKASDSAKGIAHESEDGNMGSRDVVFKPRPSATLQPKSDVDSINKRIPSADETKRVTFKRKVSNKIVMSNDEASRNGEEEIEPKTPAPRFSKVAALASVDAWDVMDVDEVETP